MDRVVFDNEVITETWSHPKSSNKGMIGCLLHIGVVNSARMAKVLLFIVAMVMLILAVVISWQYAGFGSNGPAADQAEELYGT